MQVIWFREISCKDLMYMSSAHFNRRRRSLTKGSRDQCGHSEYMHGPNGVAEGKNERKIACCMDNDGEWDESRREANSKLKARTLHGLNGGQCFQRHQHLLIADFWDPLENEIAHLKGLSLNKFKFKHWPRRAQGLIQSATGESC